MKSILTIGNNRNKCQHFTPSNIVENMLDLANYKEDLIGLTVLENSFGCGNIIKAVVKRYIECGLSKRVSKKKISEGLGRDIYGIELDKKIYVPFFLSRYYSKNYRGSLKNRENIIYYFLINTDVSYDLANTSYDEGEKEGNYELRYIPLDKVEEVLIGSIKDNPINEVIVKEMLDAIKCLEV